MQHISSGFAKIFGHKRLVFTLYFVNLLFATVCVIPLYILVQNFTSRSLIGELPGGLENMHVLADLIVNEGGGFGAVMGTMAFGLVIQLIFSLFLSGGILEVLNGGKGYKSSVFWGGAGNWFGPFFRQLLWSIPLLILPGILILVLNKIIGAVWGDDPYEYITYWTNRVVFAAVMLALFWWLRVLEYGRNEMVTSGNRSGRKGIWRGFRFVMGNFFSTMAIGFAFFIPGLILMYVHGLIQLPTAGGLGVFLAGQIYMLLRFSLKVGLASGQLSKYHSIHPPVLPAAQDIPRPINAENDSSDPEPETDESYYHTEEENPGPTPEPAATLPTEPVSQPEPEPQSLEDSSSSDDEGTPKQSES